jgi:hypothetical protein
MAEKNNTNITDLENEIRRSLLIDEEEKTYWLENLDVLPVQVFETVLRIIKEKNWVVDKYVDAALKADANIIPELKNKLKQLKKKIAAFKEIQETGAENAEERLLEEIQKL